MASSTATSKISTHARSISLPSRSHPTTATAEESLCRFRASEATSSISHKFSVLCELYENLSDMILLPLTQQSLSHVENANSVEKVLDGSLQLLDVCGASKDVLSLMKEGGQELGSSLRRRKFGDSEHECFNNSRKNVIKLSQKSLEILKKNKKKSSVEGQAQGHPSLIKMLREAEAACLSVFKSLLLVVSRSNSESKSLVSKFIRSKHVACDEEELYNSEMEKIDSALDSLRKSSKTNNTVQVQNLQKQLEAFELRVQNLEKGVESLFRHLMRIRVSLLNILNH
ncbi:Protein BPS1, chloroplastic [Dillenia turbinata]|uniref:Protein BPS1, chloroplastic n=1 Tax=Dillenia turbinata TaxID=194707 RepID=A0AAN8W097_9MAGN